MAWQMFLKSLDREPVTSVHRLPLVKLSNVMETQSLCHGSSEVDSKFTNLSLNVAEVGVAGPATHLFDDVVVFSS
jgi:hypothetical protein